MATTTDCTLGDRPIDDGFLARQFRDQANALGGLWLFFGVLCGIAAYLVSQGTIELETHIGSLQKSQALVVCIAITAIWTVLGVATCMKQVWAIYTGLILSYLTLAGNLYAFNLIGAAVSLASVSQAHRVIGWARQLRAPDMASSAFQN